MAPTDALFDKTASNMQVKGLRRQCLITDAEGAPACQRAGKP
jgi:hypothetical protein